MSTPSRRDPGDRPDYRTLPAAVPVDDTVTSLDPTPLADPHAGHNTDQHAALRDD
ncbi:hypothetical protein [Nocardioides deserti]|uniref:Uncharacterized protein n=1 Tax=Nocardioides deserti TaxID=1588644 RepID=A0ABR6U4P9_9ACTN|nr:hypothetical protein [Nocardioides deserti]MBC2959078.1 hypothetical protein [Nocardioides deserti]GGO68782.1 hypothetical protein GCM10012276_03390 [Nocardioides deserti]